MSVDLNAAFNPFNPAYWQSGGPASALSSVSSIPAIPSVDVPSIAPITSIPGVQEFDAGDQLQSFSSIAPTSFFSPIQPSTSSIPAPLNLPADLQQYSSQITAAAAQYGLNPALLAAVIQQESSGNASAVSLTGAQGLAQLEPGTAAALGVTNPFDPTQSINGGAAYLAQQLKTFGGNVSLALAAYNAGPGAVQKYGGVPPYTKTQNYVQSVTSLANQYSGGAFNFTAPQIGTNTTITGQTITNVPGSIGQIAIGGAGNPNVGTMQSPADPTASAISGLTSAFTTTANNIAYNVFLGALALALIGGGIAWLAASNPRVQEAAKTAAEVAA
jgi:hypothetical protein